MLINDKSNYFQSLFERVADHGEPVILSLTGANFIASSSFDRMAGVFGDQKTRIILPSALWFDCCFHDFLFH
jgi:hypothetical protein